MDAWQRLAPVPAMAVADYDRDLILSRQFATVRDDAEGYYLARFKTAAHRAGGQLLLGFEHPEMDGPTLPADVWNMQLAEAERRGPGLPAALRIFLASIVHVPLSARASADPFTPPVMLMGPDGRPWTLRRFLDLIYTGRKRPGEYWPVLWGSARSAARYRNAVPVERAHMVAPAAAAGLAAEHNRRLRHGNAR